MQVQEILRNCIVKSLFSVDWKDQKEMLLQGTTAWMQSGGKNWTGF